MITDNFLKELRELTNFVYENEKSFLNFVFEKTDEYYYELVKVSFTDEIVHLVALYDNNDECLHIANSIKMKDFIEWMETIKNKEINVTDSSYEDEMFHVLYKPIIT